MQIGFTSTTLRQIKDVEKIVKIAVDCGADCIEWGSDIHVKDVGTALRVKDLCDKANIRCCSYGTFYRVGKNNIDEWHEICNVASALGADVIRVWLGSENSEDTTAEEYALLVKSVQEMCKVASAHNLIVCPECHDNTFNNNTDAFLKIHKDVNCNNFLTYFQSRYCRLEYDLDRIERTSDLIGNIHVSFSEVVREQFPDYNPKYFDFLVDKIKEIGYDGCVLIEFTYVSMQYGLPLCLKNDVQKLRDKFCS